MKVKSIRGSIQYNGTIYTEGAEFEIEERHLTQIQENVAILSEKEEEKLPEESTGEIDYGKLKKAELLELLKGKGLEAPEKATNAELVAILEGDEA